MKKLLTLLFFVTLSVNSIAQDLEGLKVGDVAPDFTLYDQHENPFKLSKKLQNGPVVIFFYRGSWCPFCTKYMKNYQDSLAMITAKGAQIVGISPQGENAVQKSIEKTGARFPLLMDDSKRVCFKYVTLTKEDMSNSESNPTPALYIVGKDGKIKYANYPPSFTDRASVRQILEHLD